MNIEIHTDLATYAQAMADNLGITEDSYVNNLIERGIYDELRENYPENKVSAFMAHLRLQRSPDWSLLE